MTVLALDFGLNLGWAVYFGPGDIMHGTTSFKPGRFESVGHVFLRFRAWLNEMAEDHGPIEAVYFEEVRRHLGVDAAHLYGAFHSHLLVWAEKAGIPWQGVPVGTIKKHATGKGNANKKEMIAAVLAKGFTAVTDNDADALALLFCVTEGKEAA